jgi:hypothetical protein
MKPADRVKREKRNKYYLSVYVISFVIFMSSCVLHFAGYFSFFIGFYALYIYIPIFILWTMLIVDATVHRSVLTDFYAQCNKILLCIGIGLTIYMFVIFSEDCAF